MTLQDKAKEDFLEWYGADERYFETTATKTEEYANVIEWLDSVEIYINVSPILDEGFITYSSSVSFINNMLIDCTPISTNGSYYTENRLEATKAAIEKANEIYNQSPN